MFESLNHHWIFVFAHEKEVFSLMIPTEKNYRLLVVDKLSMCIGYQWISKEGNTIWLFVLWRCNYHSSLFIYQGKIMHMKRAWQILCVYWYCVSKRSWKVCHYRSGQDYYIRRKLQTCGLYVSHVRPIKNIIYLSVMWISVSWVKWEVVTGVEGTPCRGSLRHMLANRVLVYPSQGIRYCAEGCMALG